MINHTHDEIVARMRDHIWRKYKTQKVAAEALGISYNALQQAATGKREIHRKMLDDMGLVKTVVKTVEVFYQPK